MVVVMSAIKRKKKEEKKEKETLAEMTVWFANTVPDPTLCDLFNSQRRFVCLSVVFFKSLMVKSAIVLISPFLFVVFSRQSPKGK